MSKSSSVLKGELKSLESNRTALKARLEQLTAIRNDLQFGLDDEVSSINSYKNKADDYLRHGLKGVSNSSLFDGGYEYFKQNIPTVDTTLSSCLSNINSEISRCESEVENCNTQIRSKNQQIEQATAKEKQEAEQSK